MSVLLRRLFLLLAALTLGSACAVSGARAAAGPWVDNDQGRLRLVAAADAIGETGEPKLGLQIELKDGWKTYWRSPGDAGFPVSVDWSGSGNLASTRFEWPVPHRFTLFGLDTFGYEKEVVFPIAAKAADPGRPLALTAKVDYLVCAEICVPQSATLTLDLPPGAARPAREAFLIDRFEARVPEQGSGHSGLTLERTGVGGTATKPTLVAQVRSAVPLLAPDLLVETGSDLRFGAPAVKLAADKRSATLTLPVTFGPQGERPVAGTPATLTLVDGNRGLEQATTLQPLAAAPEGPAGERAAGFGGLAAILGLALLGGLILNLMPCVLPVLSIKLLSAIGHGGRETGAVRLSFLASAAGILASFLLLAGAAIAVKAAGLAVGWGIQFQQPLFLAAMALLVVLFALNLFGLFEIPLPGWLGGVATIGHGPGGTGGHSLAGNFLTGAFATLLATPCSAPFLGTAVGFALSRGAPEILAVFTALGLGLALPYLLVAAAPGLATRLPRPGRWMITLRRLLGLALVGTAAWLLSVLAVQLGWLPTAGVALLLGAVALLIALRRRLPRPAAALGGAALVALLLVVAAWPQPTPGGRAGASHEAGWQPLDVAAIPALVAEGKVVFVDVTADWCITCQVNKALVLDDPQVQAALGGKGIVRLRGDWTRPDPAIAGYLAGFGRYGIPFNAVYGPAAPNGKPLPELLTVEQVLSALAAAGPSGHLAARD
ncbi:suppressor for copper-sensitivity B [Tistlia consotensis]|uniref:Suppressor for copper-sensitivity B n=1 Tax=Tistlia consotensis USBA 355 TaxID=560819 RepID=A0A1Y6B7Q4_9PROT|nr:protein-disulfide reductase DsbD domain-containing protein [Tistlia consotensis]SME94548.1 suppressor for copper-sensitivity B [Tistlia consotensis USBA 355]SNR29415.1 suppressor for copper-sensitivity B [Tistlia consotensis]